jgi:hypothetical protein
MKTTNVLYCAAAVMIAFLTGCDSSLDGPVIPHEKLRQIEPFNPEPYRSSEQTAEPDIRPKPTNRLKKFGSICPKPVSWRLKTISISKSSF